MTIQDGFRPIFSPFVGLRVTIDSSARPATGAATARSGRRWRDLVGPGLLAIVAAAGYSVFALARYATFRTGSYDLVIFDQAVRSYAHLHPGISIVKGVHNGFGPHFSVLGDHWSPILAVLAPLYWVHNSAANLLVAQAVLFALAIPPLWMFTRRAFGGGRNATVAAYLVSVAYGLSWPVAAAVGFDFHEVAFAPVLTAVALERLQAGRWRTALVALAGLLLVKEDMGFLVAGIGVYLALSRPRALPRPALLGLGLIVAGVADTAITTYVLIPAFGGRSGYYWGYQALGNNVPQVLGHLVTHPLGSARVLITPRVKLETMLWLLAAFCFLPLCSPLTLAAVPLVLERMLDSKFPNWWVTSFQYNAYLVIILAFAAVDGAARLERWVTALRGHATARRGAVPARAGPAATDPATPDPAAADPAAADPAAADPAAVGAAAVGAAAVPDPGNPAPAIPGNRAPADPGAAGAEPPGPAPGRPVARGRVALGCAVAMAAVAVALVPRFAFGPALHPSFYHRTPRMSAAAAAVAAVPSGVTVQAVNNLGPQLSGRDTVLLWDGDGETPLFSPWVVADVRRRVFTFHTLREQWQRVGLLERSGYQVVFRRAGYLVLHRVGTGRTASRAGGAQ